MVGSSIVAEILSPNAPLLVLPVASYRAGRPGGEPHPPPGQIGKGLAGEPPPQPWERGARRVPGGPAIVLPSRVFIFR
jgi:hypothetical protein